MEVKGLPQAQFVLTEMMRIIPPWAPHRTKQFVTSLPDRTSNPRFNLSGHPQHAFRRVHGTYKASAIDDHDDPLYKYTSGRWLYNERLRLSERRKYFDVDALCKVVADSVNESTDEIIRFSKIAEGGAYRIFETFFEGDSSVIARLPYPVTVPHKYGIASEVATMRYLRLHDIPVPKILSWSDEISNSVGSEYMIMEKAPGKELESVWYTMTFEERKTMMEKIVNVESKLFDLRFPANGSLYLTDSLDPGIKTVGIPSTTVVAADEFCVGPSTEYLWWYQGRHRLGVDGGPWRSTEDVLLAAGQRELSWLNRFGEPRLPREPLYREFYDFQKVSPRGQMDNLTKYLEIFQYMVPKDRSLNNPTLRHPDFSPNNIFVSESGDITGLIGWQHSAILPMFIQAKIPKHFQNYGDDDSESLQRPRLPEDFEGLSDDDKTTAMEVYRRRQVHYFYLGFTSQNNKPHFDAMARYDLVVRNKIYEAASRPWEGDGVSLKAEMIRLAAQWPGIVVDDSVDFPLRYSDTEVEECLDIDEKQEDADDQMQRIRDHFGITIEGWVPHGLYTEAKQKESALKELTLEKAESEKDRREIVENWPFQDHEEID